jgi:multiple sugar transport system substrate-binding protein
VTGRPAYRGLTWDHPRGYRALEAAARAATDDLDLAWDRQSLEGFEAAPIGDLARRYDLIVIDHPHAGDVAAADCLLPLDTLFGEDELMAWRGASVGESFASYRYGGKQWALPLDAATQVAAYRADLVGDDGPPRHWQAVIDLAARKPVALSIAGPHAVLTFFSLCVALGEAPASRDPERLIGTDTGVAALEIIAAIYGRMPAGIADKNPIGILETMATHRDIAYCPLVYGYVTYTVGAGDRGAITFADVPVATTRGPLGSTLGGTGIAVSRRADVTPALTAHLRHLMDGSTQCGFIPLHDGQPSARSAWRDHSVNEAAGGFYRDTLKTIEAAWVRPRFPGYIAFQADAAAALRRALDERTPHRRVVEMLQGLYRAHRSPGDEN